MTRIDPIAEEVIISLRDEPERFRLRLLPEIEGMLQLCLERDDGLVISTREMKVFPYARALALFGGDHRYVARGPNRRALLRALDGWVSAPA